jgi:hypothetical protein
MLPKANWTKTTWSIVPTVVALMSMLVTGCDSSKNPLDKPKAEAFDKKLIGLWRGKQEGHDVYLHIVALKPPMMKAVVITYPLNDEHVGVDQYETYETVSGSNKFLNLKVPAAEPNKHEMEYLFAKYDFAPDGKLTIVVPDFKNLEDAVKTHKLSGKAWTDSLGTNVAIDDSGEHLLKYIQSADTKFTTYGTFHRVIEEQE